MFLKKEQWPNSLLECHQEHYVDMSMEILRIQPDLKNTLLNENNVIKCLTILILYY